jgi:hypothetical protein
MGDDEVLTAHEVSTYFAAADWVLGLVGSDEVARAWSEPSALTRYSTGGVAAHVLMGAVLRLEQVLDEAEPSDRRRVGPAEAFGPNRMDGPDNDDPLFDALRSRSEQLAEAGPHELLRSVALPYARLRDLLPQSAADRAVSLIRLPDGQLSLRDTLRTRVLELVVHGDDLAASVTGWEPVAPPADAVDVCLTLSLELAVARVGGLSALRAFTRAERAEPDALRVL